MKHLHVLVILLIFLCGCTSPGKGNDTRFSLSEAIEESAKQMAQELPKNSRVAVVAFESLSNNLSNYILDELNGALHNRGVRVVDRQNLVHVFNELDFQTSSTVDEKTACSIGKIVGADMVITGQLTNLGDMYRYQASVINVETAVRASITRFYVRNDKAMQRMIEAMQ